MKKISKLAVAGLLTMTMAFGAGCSSNNNQAADPAPAGDEVREEVVLKVGTNPTFEPFEFMDDDNNIVGFDIDLIQAIADDQGLAIEIVDMEFDALVMALQSGGLDIIASGLSITPARQEQVDFTDEYIQAGLTIAIAVDNEDINGV